jgi:hypothetical protein
MITAEEIQAILEERKRLRIERYGAQTPEEEKARSRRLKAASYLGGRRAVGRSLIGKRAVRG